MARKPLFSSQRAQDAIVAAVMVLLLFGSLGGAYALASARRAQQAPVELVPVQIGDLRIKLPETWRIEEVRGLPRHIAGKRLVDSRRETRALTILRYVSTTPTDGASAMRQTLPGLWPPGVAETLETAVLTNSVHATLDVVEWIGASQARGDAVLTHMAASLSRDPRVHWILYLTDRAEPTENPNAVLNANLGLLRGVLHGAAIDPPAAQP